ncbi:MAG: hypothetical protein R2684_14455 [Pyrinomonadaceae bacterium]
MTTIFAGTKKGLFVFRGDQHKECKIHFEGQNVYAVGEAEGRIWASPFTEWTGSVLASSSDGGNEWEEMEVRPEFPEDTETAMKGIWQIKQKPGGGIMFGAEPSSVFLANSTLEDWSLVRGLWNHPHREKWGPGYGGQCLHTIVPLTESEWVVGMSTGGVYRTEDAGESWVASNSGIVAPFLPDPAAEFGQCVHKIAADPEVNGQLFLQHHWGVYRSRDRGKTWQNISEDRGLPSDFGFGVVSTGANTAFIIPLKSDMFRVFPDGKCAVYRTTDAGENWERLDKGLPQENAFDIVLRDSFSSNGENIAFGTTAGSLFYSEDNGDGWTEVASNLPRITCVRIVED